jgi:hypothetical protein
MAALLPICFVTNDGGLVYSRSNQTGFVIPPLYQEDGLPLEVSAVKRINHSPDVPFEVINLAGYALKISIGTANSILATQEAWTLSADGTSLSGTLDLNTAAINALADTYTSARFEIRLNNGVSFFRGQFEVVIKKSVALAGAVNPVVSDTALGRLEAARTYMKKEGAPGEGFILTSADNLKKCFEYLHNDGGRRSEPLT